MRVLGWALVGVMVVAIAIGVAWAVRSSSDGAGHGPAPASPTHHSQQPSQHEITSGVPMPKGGN
ncbi:hypothetical protein [Actinocatenispora sera]|nr:hypothetical protein [Actinocatenispora sera]